MFSSRVALAAALLVMTACKPTTPFQQEAWDEVRSRLKAPSTAKLAEFRAYDVHDSQRKEYFLRSIHEIQWAFKVRESLLKDGWSLKFSLLTLLGYMPKDQAAGLMAGLKQGVPSQGYVLEEITNAKDKLNLSGTFRPSKKELPEALRVIEAAITNASTRELGRYEKLNGTFEAKNILLDYDAQNSFGAMLRGHAQFFGLKVGKVTYLLDPSEPFDRVLVGLPADPYA